MSDWPTPGFSSGPRGKSTSIPAPATGDAGKVLTVNGTEDGYELDASSGGGSSQFVQLGGGTGTSVGMFYQPFDLLPDTSGMAGGAQALLTLPGAGGGIGVQARVPSTVELGYAELFVTSLDGSEALGIEADAGTALVDGESVDWTGFSTFGAAGTDLSADAGGITSAAGGTYLVTFIAYPSA